MTPASGSKTTDDSLSKSRLRLWLKLLKGSNLIADKLRRQMRAELSTTLPRFDVMSALSRAPDGLKMSEISKRLRVSNGNITGIVDTLVAEGFVERVAVPGDRRASLVLLTPAGRAVFAEHARHHEAWLNEILGGLDHDDIDRRVCVLDHMSKTLGGEA